MRCSLEIDGMRVVLTREDGVKVVVPVVTAGLEQFDLGGIIDLLSARIDGAQATAFRVINPEDE